jgi:Grx4 family monothiol glutaredoxin
VIAFLADWDDSSKVTKSMIEEYPTTYNSIIFRWVDCDTSDDIVDEFNIESVPSLAIVMPHKDDKEIIAGPTPEQISAHISELDSTFKQMYEKEKQMAYREIDLMVKNNPVFMFIKGTLDAPKCKFTRKLVDTLAPFKYRNLKTFDILGDTRIRQWLKYYTKWPTFPQVYINGEFAGGLDVVLEMITEGEFDEMVPESCKKLNP